MTVISHDILLQQADSWLSDAAAAQVAQPDLPLGSFAPASTALCILDMVNGFAVSGALASPRVGALIEPIAVLARRCREVGMPVFAFADTHTPESPELSSYPPHCLRGTAEAEVCAPIAAVPGLVTFEKNSTNGFLEDPFRRWLEDNPGIRTLIAVGDCTDICVYQFAVAAKAYFNTRNHDARVIVPTALTDTFDAPGHPADLLNTVFRALHAGQRRGAVPANSVSMEGD